MATRLPLEFPAALRRNVFQPCTETGDWEHASNVGRDISPTSPAGGDTTSSARVSATSPPARPVGQPASGGSDGFYCSVCRKRFTTESTLQTHLGSQKHRKAASAATTRASPRKSPKPNAGEQAALKRSRSAHPDNSERRRRAQALISAASGCTDEEYAKACKMLWAAAKLLAEDHCCQGLAQCLLRLDATLRSAGERLSPDEQRLQREVCLALGRVYRPFSALEAMEWYEQALATLGVRPAHLARLDALLGTDSLKEALATASEAVTGMPRCVASDAAEEWDTVAKGPLVEPGERGQAVKAVASEAASYVGAGLRRCSLLALQVAGCKAGSAGRAKALVALGDAAAAAGEAWMRPHCQLMAARAVITPTPRGKVSQWLLQALEAALMVRDHVLCANLEAAADSARQLWGAAGTADRTCASCSGAHPVFPEELDFAVAASAAWRTADETWLASNRSRARRLSAAPTCPSFSIGARQLLEFLRARPGLA